MIYQHFSFMRLMDVYHCGQEMLKTTCLNWIKSIPFEKILRVYPWMQTALNKIKKKGQIFVDQKLVRGSKIKLEHTPDPPSIFGITPVEESEDVHIWTERAHKDRFILIVPKTWDTI